MTENEETMDYSSESDSETDEKPNENCNTTEKNVYLPTKPLEEGEELVCDKSAYVMLHQAQTGAPCLSFDIISDILGDKREEFPLTAYIGAGTQSSQSQANHVIVMKLSNLNKMENKDEDEEESDEEDDSSDPKMSAALLKHQGCVNRLRCVDLKGTKLCATWSEIGRVNIWDLKLLLEAVENEKTLAKFNKETKNNILPIYTFKGHQTEGYAMDWCRTNLGVLATGDCKKNIHVWNPTENGSWNVDQRPLVGHTDSVEDLQWSPNERHVLASCSVDKSIRVWDTRAQPTKACMLTANDAHSLDVNVISWNRNEPFIVSGGDDGQVIVWDLRKFAQKTPVAIFKHHTEPVTTVEWHPGDSAVFASGGADNQIALWDLSVEKDSETDANEVEGIPPQLLFIHQGQTNVKELHWHPQLTSVIISTAENNFNIFRTISI